MKNNILYTLFFLLLSLASCNSVDKQSQEDPTPKTPVQIVTVSTGAIDDELSFLGTTFYMNRNLVVSSIPAFITQVNVKLGDKVKKGDVLYVLQSKESKALNNSALDPSLKNFGIIQVRASASGVITTLDKQQQGDYVLEGTQLCTIAESSDLVFQVNVPFEYTHRTKIGNSCTIILPDNSQYPARFTKELTAMNVTAQTQTILASCSKSLFLPENMIVKVLVNTSSGSKKQILPKSCVLSDEMMNDFWVMKLINDTTVVKVPVKIGNKNTDKIEILSPLFNPSDRIVSTGNYGLEDHSTIEIVQ